jgi:hypothetical protein
MARCDRARVNAGRISGGPGWAIAKREYGVQEIASRGDRGHRENHEDHDRPSYHMERLPVQHMGFQVEHGGPDPHGRQHLDQGEPPVGEQQLYSLKEHGEGTDGQGQGS